VRCNGRSIGSATSGATERANPDCEDLFLYLWNNIPDATAGVSGGRGASAGADWAANKTILIPSLRGVLPIGLATMGNADGGSFSGVPVVLGSATAAGSVLGANTHTLSTSELPTFNPASSITPFTPAGTISAITPAGTITQSPITPSGSVSISDSRTWGFNYGGVTNIPVGGTSVAGDPGASGFSKTVTVTGGSISGSFTGNAQTLTFAGTPTTPTFTGTQITPTGSNIGSGSAHNNMPRVLLGTYFIKL